MMFVLIPSGVARGQDSEPFKIVCTIGQLANAAQAIAGNHARVEALMGEGVDPHLYKPTRSDLVKLRRADVILANGLLLEGKMTDALRRLSKAGQRVHMVAESIDSEILLHPEYFKGAADPHVWMDPQMWMVCVEQVRDAITAYDPQRASEYEANAAAYLRELEMLDEYAQRVLATVPEKWRVLVTAHDAFNYFGRRFDFEVMGIQGISTQSEAGVRDIEKLVTILVEKRIPAVFVESTVSERNIRALIAGAKAQGHRVALGASLFSDAMGRPGTYEGTFIGMLDHNITGITRALGGQAPAGGMQGKLAGHTEEQ
jgi:manganese/zinc/iron transport system substrate-binding protein